MRTATSRQDRTASPQVEAARGRVYQIPEWAALMLIPRRELKVSKEGFDKFAASVEELREALKQLVAKITAETGPAMLWTNGGNFHFQSGTRYRATSVFELFQQAARFITDVHDLGQSYGKGWKADWVTSPAHEASLARGEKVQTPRAVLGWIPNPTANPMDALTSAMRLKPFTYREFCLSVFAPFDGSAPPISGFRLLGLAARAGREGRTVDHLLAPALRELFDRCYAIVVKECWFPTDQSAITLPLCSTYRFNLVDYRNHWQTPDIESSDPTHLRMTIRAAATELEAQLKNEDRVGLGSPAVLDAFGRELFTSADELREAGRRWARQEAEEKPRIFKPRWAARLTRPETNPVRELEKTLRPSRPGEIVVRLESVDRLFTSSLLTARDFVEREPYDPGEKFPYCEKFDTQATDRRIWDIAGDLLNTLLLNSWEIDGLEGDPILTSSFPDVRIATSDGKIAFENIGHLFCIGNQIARFHFNELKRLSDLLGVKIEDIDFAPMSPMQSLTYLSESHGFIPSKTADEILMRFSFEGAPVFIQARNLFLDGYGHEFQPLLREALTQLYGRIPEVLDPHFDNIVISDERGANKIRLGQVIQQASEELQISEDPGHAILLEFLRFPREHEIFRVETVSIARLIAHSPTLRSLYYPRKVESGEAAITIKAFQMVRAHLKSILESPAEYYGSYAYLRKDSDLRKDVVGREQKIEAYRKRFDSLLRVIGQCIDEAVRPFELSEELYSTAPPKFANTVFTDSYGNVFAESYGQLFSIYRAILEYAKECEQQIAKLFKSRPDPLNPIADDSCDPFFTLRGNLSRLNADQHHLWTEKFQTFGTIDYTLATLDRCKAISDLTPETATQALREACVQALGFQPGAHYLVKFIAPLHFCNTVATFACTGEDLIKIARPGQPSSSPSSKVNKGTPAPAPQGPTKEELQHRLYQELFEDLSVPIGPVFLALCAMGNATETRKGLTTFRDRIIVSLDERGQTSYERSVKDPINAFKSFFALHENVKRKVDLSELGRARFTDLLQQLCYRSYNGDLSRMQSELESFLEGASESNASHAVADQLIREIVPRLIKLYQAIREFEDPESITFNPIAHQREAALAALYGGRPIVVMGPGTGKTKTGVLIAEASDFEQVLWCTKSSNRTDTRNHVAEAIDPTKCVVELSPEEARLSKTELKAFLAKAHIVVTGYDTLREMEKANPEGFTVLQRWIARGMKILDEAHLLDNVDSKRSQAIQKLSSEKTIALTATPVQHRPERVATLLHLTLPDKYPDARVLQQQFKSDKALARVLFHSHATLMAIEDVAMPFVSFDVQSAEEQLKLGIPRIPRLHIHRKQYTMSIAHSVTYAEVSTNYDPWADENGKRHGGLHQFANLHRLAGHPEKLGEAPPFALISAVKEIVMPALERGEKVLILGDQHHLLNLLADDPEFQAKNTILLTGHDSSARRAAEMKRFEDDSTLRCVIGNVDAIGTGYNCRGIEHIVFVERPRLTSRLIQGMARHRRILTEGDAHLAVSDVHVWFVEPELSKEVLDLIDDPLRLKYLSRGTIYSSWLERDLSRIEEYQALTSRDTKITPSEVGNVAALVNELAGIRDALAEQRAHFDLLRSQKLQEIYYRYRTKEKNAWRSSGVARFVETNLNLLRRPPELLHGACLPGPEALEVPVYLNAGFLPQNVINFEADPDEAVRSYCRQEINKLGCRIFESRMEAFLPHWPVPLGLVSVDTHGYLTPKWFKMFVELNLEERAIIMKNSLCQRESGEALALLKAAGANRRELDLDLLMLSSSKLHTELGTEKMVELLNRSKRLRSVADACAGALFKILKVDREGLSEAFASLACNSPLLLAFRQLEYLTPKGRPFLSTFAVVEQWDTSIRALEGVKAVRGFMHALAQSSSSIKLSVAARTNDIVLTSVGRTEEVVTLSRRELALFNSYFTGTVEAKHYRSALERGVPERLKV